MLQIDSNSLFQISVQKDEILCPNVACMIKEDEKVGGVISKFGNFHRKNQKNRVIKMRRYDEIEKNESHRRK